MNGAASYVFGDLEREALKRVLLVRLDNLGDVLLTTEKDAVKLNDARVYYLSIEADVDELMALI